MKYTKSQAGQAGLVVMLIMVVLLTLGISIASRSTQSVSQSTQEQESSRVFDAAEAGIEHALSGVLAAGQGTVDVNGLSATYTVSEVSQLDARVDEGHVVAVDTTGYVGNVTISWSKVSNCTTEDPASIEVAIFNGTTRTVRRVAYAGCSHIGDNFLSSASGTAPYAYQAQVAVVAGENLMRIRPVYNDTFIRVVGGDGFPVQYHRILSQATNETGGETRAVAVDRTIPSAPAIFDYVLFSGSGLSK